MNKRTYQIFPLILGLMLIFNFSSVSAKDIHPGGPFVQPNQNVSYSAIMTFDEVEKELLKLEKRGKNLLQVDIAGHTLENRPLYIAKIGHGPKKMWVQGRIHGNEPFGNNVCLELLKSLLASDKKLLDEMTFWVIPSYNPDGSEYYWRGNALGIDLNRDWNRNYRWDFRVEWADPSLNQRDYPLLPAQKGYFQPESQAFRLAWEDFRPDYMIDIHHQGTPVVEGTNEMTTFSLGISVAEHSLKGLSGIDGHPLPGAPDLTHIWDTCRRMAVVGYDAAKKLGFCTPTMYWFEGIDIWEGVTSSQMLGLPGDVPVPSWDGTEDDIAWVSEHNTAAIFFETRGGIGNKSRGYLIRQNVVALHAIIESIASDELEKVDPERWWELPWSTYDYGDWGYQE
jgi:hypothetical protein